MANAIRKVALTEVTVGAAVTGEATKLAAETTSTAASILLAEAKAVAHWIAGIAAQASAGPYIGFALVAAMAGIAACYGLKGGGRGSAPAYAEDTQKQNGTGSVLGDSAAKSTSIADGTKTLTH